MMELKVTGELLKIEGVAAALGTFQSPLAGSATLPALLELSGKFAAETLEMCM